MVVCSRASDGNPHSAVAISPLRSALDATYRPDRCATCGTERAQQRGSNEMTKPYGAQRYPVAITVRVIFPEFPDAPLVDGVKGLNAGHALWRARQNWPNASVAIIRDED